MFLKIPLKPLDVLMFNILFNVSCINPGIGTCLFPRIGLTFPRRVNVSLQPQRGPVLVAVGSLIGCVGLLLMGPAPFLHIPV